jgi:hypothetical protein
MGGELRIPALGWKWDWLRHVFDWSVAKRLALGMRSASNMPPRYLDYICSRIE